MIFRLSLLAAVIACAPMLRASEVIAADPVNRAEPDWWLTPRRMIQTNLREIDAGMDVESRRNCSHRPPAWRNRKNFPLPVEYRDLFHP